MNFHLYLDATFLLHLNRQAFRWCTRKLNESPYLLIQLFGIGVGSMEELHFQSLVFCRGRQYLDGSVIFPGVGHIWPNFLPAHNDEYGNLSTHLWTCLLMYFSMTISICLQDCIISGGNAKKRKKTTKNRKYQLRSLVLHSALWDGTQNLHQSWDSFRYQSSTGN